jgi:hypothetical protein
MISNFKLTFICSAMFLMSPALADMSRDDVIGHSQGNHRLDCTILRPWSGDGGPASIPDGGFDIIGWTNGWGQGEVFGAEQVENYVGGLDYFVEQGNYLVIAANQWSAREPDIVQCLDWLIQQSEIEDSDYYGAVDASDIGLSGHSQGGGAALKAGGSVGIDTVVAMNPYGPSYVKALDQNDQIFILSGDSDGVTPTSSMSAIIDGVILSGTPGGLLAELVGGTHCNPACRDDFGIFGEAALLWFDMFLRDEDNCVELMNLLMAADPSWNLAYSDNFVCSGG